MSSKKKLESSLEGLFSKSKVRSPIKKDVENEVPLASPPAEKPAVQPAPPPARKAVSKPASKPAKPSAQPKKAAAPKASEVQQIPAEKPAVKQENNPQPTPVPVKVEPVFQPKPEPEVKAPVQEAVQPEKPAQEKNEHLNKEPEKEIVEYREPVKALSVAEDSDEEEETQLLVFRIDEVDYGVEVSFVQTIIKPQAVFLVPGTVEYIKGLINLRGEVVPVVDLRTRFGLSEKEADRNTRFVVIEVGDAMASLVVDAVQGVITLPSSVIDRPADVVMDIDTKYMKGIARFEEQLILILSLTETIRTPVQETVS